MIISSKKYDPTRKLNINHKIRTINQGLAAIFRNLENVR